MSIFEFFFKYKPIIYQKGHLAFQLLGSRWLFVFFIAAAVAGAYYAYRAVAQDKYSAGLVALRAITFTVLAFIVLRPVLNISTVLPQESYLAVVIDNSESMKIKDDGKVARSEELQKQFQATNFFKRLNDKFKIRTYRFDSTAERIDKPEQLNFAGKRTSLESATDLLQQELGTVPLSGVVLITDGVDNASKQWTESLSKLESRKIPFYTVGVGSDNVTRDAEVVKVSAPRSSLKESTAVVDVSYRSHGFSGRKATLFVRENGVLLKTEQVTLPPDGEIGETTLDLPVKNEGTRLFSFTLEAPEDRIPENNTLDALVEIKNDHPQILYIEGEPRWEFKYIRRALQDDPNIRLVTLERTSPNKFYRQGLDKEETLAEGFPKKKEELFGYKGLIFGSIESTFFTQDQLKMVVDFVSNRGGGFLMLGGRNSFSGGHYENSPIADILPVQLPAGDRTPVIGPVKMVVTDYGRTHPLMKLNPDVNGNVVKDWSELPPVNDYNKTLDAKVGGIVLARGQPQQKGGPEPILLAYQRYGRGRSMALTTGSTWHWQMGMDYKDQTHEMFWKQTLRWLVNSSPDPVMITSDKDTYLPGETVRLSADVSNKTFERMNNAKVVAKVTNPDGLVETIPLDWNGAAEGTYQAELNATGAGVYQVDIEAVQGSETLGTNHTAFQVQDRPVEFYNPAVDTRLLQSVATSTGGKYYPLSKMGDVPDDAQYFDGESTFIEQKELWDVPFLFMLLCLTLGGEWFWRKRKGLA
ncbi:MAG TPA: glutamine amidotransferase [Terriglobia bacterium]|nr:glutamine amidotransferase [Terriglobia bacterium]